MLLFAEVGVGVGWVCLSRARGVLEWVGYVPARGGSFGIREGMVALLCFALRTDGRTHRGMGLGRGARRGLFRQSSLLRCVVGGLGGRLRRGFGGFRARGLVCWVGRLGLGVGGRGRFLRLSFWRVVLVLVLLLLSFLSWCCGRWGTLTVVLVS